MQKSHWRAPAKINLFLHVVGRYADGYHELQTAFQLLDWCDELEFQCTKDGVIRRVTPNEKVAQLDDIVIRSARLLRQRCPGAEGVSIAYHKHVPIGAGLGGGSSDAATTLLALNELWGLNLERAQLAAIGVEIGADVPVFVYGKNAWAQGRGEVLSDISIPERLYLVVYPACAVSTKRVFEAFDGTAYREKLTIETMDTLRFGNDLEAVTCQLYPQVRQAIERLRNWGEARMTGSGSAVYLTVESRTVGEKIRAQLPADWTTRVCIGQGS